MKRYGQLCKITSFFHCPNSIQVPISISNLGKFPPTRKIYLAFDISWNSRSRANNISCFVRCWKLFFKFSKSPATSQLKQTTLQKSLLMIHYYATPTTYAFQESCCSKFETSSYFTSRPEPNPFMLLISPASGICRIQKWTERNPASSKQSLISGNDHLRAQATSCNAFGYND